MSFEFRISQSAIRNCFALALLTVAPVAGALDSVLILTISLDKTQYKFGEGIVSTLKITNTTSETLETHYPNPMFPTTRLTIWSINKAAPIEVSYGGEYVTYAGKRVRIPPGGSVNYVIDLLKDHAIYATPGKYWITAMYKSVRAAKDEVEGDTIVSPRIYFTVTPLTGKDAEAYEWYCGIYGKGDKADSIYLISKKSKIDVYQVFLNRFPNSFFTYRVRFDQAEFLSSEARYFENEKKSGNITRKIREKALAKWDTLLNSKLPPHREKMVRFFLATTTIESGDTTKGFKEMMKVQDAGVYAIEEWRKKLILNKKQ